MEFLPSTNPITFLMVLMLIKIPLNEQCLFCYTLRYCLWSHKPKGCEIATFAVAPDTLFPIFHNPFCYGSKWNSTGAPGLSPCAADVLWPVPNHVSPSRAFGMLEPPAPVSLRLRSLSRYIGSQCIRTRWELKDYIFFTSEGNDAC